VQNTVFLGEEKSRRRSSPPCHGRTGCTGASKSSSTLNPHDTATNQGTCLCTPHESQQRLPNSISVRALATAVACACCQSHRPPHSRAAGSAWLLSQGRLQPPLRYRRSNRAPLQACTTTGHGERLRAAGNLPSSRPAPSPQVPPELHGRAHCSSECGVPSGAIP